MSLPGTEKELKPGLFVTETRHEEESGRAVKCLAFRNATPDRQFVCKYTLREAEGVVLGATAAWGDGAGAVSVSVHPGESGVVLATGRWSGLSKSIASGQPSAQWVAGVKDTLRSTLQADLQTLLVSVSTQGGYSTEQLQNLSHLDVARFCSSTATPYLDTEPELSVPSRCFNKPLRVDSVHASSTMDVVQYVNKGNIVDPCFAVLLSSVVLAERNGAGILSQIFSNAANTAQLNVGSIFSDGMWKTVVTDSSVPHIVSGASYADCAAACTTVSAGYSKTALHLKDMGASPSWLPSRVAHLETAWSALLEKIYVKEVALDYLKIANLKPLYPTLGFLITELTGMPVKTYPAAELSGANGGRIAESFATLRAAVDQGAVVLACSSEGKHDKIFSVLGLLEVTAADRLIKLRDPTSSFDACADHNTTDTPNGDSSMDQSNLSATGMTLGHHLGPYGVDDVSASYLYRAESMVDGVPTDTSGVFFMDFATFLKNFTFVHIGYTHQDLQNVNIGASFGVEAEVVGEEEKANGCEHLYTSEAFETESGAVVSEKEVRNLQFGHIGARLTHNIEGPGSLWVGLTQDGHGFDKKLKNVLLFVVTVEPRKNRPDKVSVLESVAFSRKTRLVEVRLSKETAGKPIYVIPQLKSGSLEEGETPPGYSLSLWFSKKHVAAPKPQINLTFVHYQNSEETLCAYATAKEVKSAHWLPVGDNAVFQARGAALCSTLQDNAVSLDALYPPPACSSTLLWVKRGGLVAGSTAASEDLDLEIERLASERQHSTQSDAQRQPSVGKPYWEEEVDLAYSMEASGAVEEEVVKGVPGPFLLSPITPAAGRAEEFVHQLVEQTDTNFHSTESEDVGHSDSDEVVEVLQTVPRISSVPAMHSDDDVVTRKPRKSLIETMRMDNNGGVGSQSYVSRCR